MVRNRKVVKVNMDSRSQRLNRKSWRVLDRVRLDNRSGIIYMLSIMVMM
jgi:hypothetical protein